MASQSFMGIDFGNSYCRIGVCQNGAAAEVVVDELGNRSIATFVSVAEDGKRVLGDTAKRQAPRKLDTTFFDLKVMLGQEAAAVAEVLAKAPFPTTTGPKGEIQLNAASTAAKKVLTPELLVRGFFSKLKEIAENGIGAQIDKAVISVPPSWSDARRAAVIAAATGAGLRVLSLLHEPTAVVVAMGLDRVGGDSEVVKAAAVAAGDIDEAEEDEEDDEAAAAEETAAGAARHVLVYDLGGQGVTASVLAVQQGVVSLSSSSTVAGVGGDAMDKVLAGICCKAFTRKTKGLKVEDSKKSVGKLMAACEEARRTLSTAPQVRERERERERDEGGAGCCVLLCIVVGACGVSVRVLWGVCGLWT